MNIQLSRTISDTFKERPRVKVALSSDNDTYITAVQRCFEAHEEQITDDQSDLKSYIHEKFFTLMLSESKNIDQKSENQLT